MSFLRALLDKPLLSISQDALTEFQQINNQVNFKENDAIVSRQDLRLLANWTFGTKGVSDYLLTKDEYTKFNAVYFIKQIKGMNSIFRDPGRPIPNDYSIIYKGNYFEVYKIEDAKELPTEPQKVFKGIVGTIVENSENRLLVKDKKTGNVRTVFIKNMQQKNLNLQNGMMVEINGEWTPFSLAINAETIKEIKSFR